MKKLLMLLVILCLCAFSACAEEEEVQYYVDFETYDMTGERMMDVEVEDWEGNITSEQYSGVGIIALPGEIIGECLKDMGYLSLSLELDGFEGWMLYENVVTVDEFGSEEFEYVKFPEDKLYTTEEILAMPVPEHHVVFVAKWADIPVEDYFTETELGLDDWTVTGTFSLLAEDGAITFDGEEMQSGCYTYWMEEDGQTLEELTAGSEDWAKAIGAEKEGATFTGWTVYEAANVIWGSASEEDGARSWLFSSYGEDTYIVLAEPTVYSENATTEELYAIPVNGVNYLAVANWE